MPFHIKELFLEIVKYCNDIPTIINFNKISKIHYEWINNKKFIEIKYALIWLNSQRLLKNPSIYVIDKGYIENWADFASNGQLSYISKMNFLDAILLYNQLNSHKIIGDYPFYNIAYKFIYPNAEHVLEYGVPNPKYKHDYKNFPEPIKIVYNLYKKRILYYISTKKINKKDLQLLQNKPYMFKWMSNDRPA